jgi:hypothetical protein
MTDADNDKFKCPHCEKLIDHSPVLHFLRTEQGKEIVNSVLAYFRNHGAISGKNQWWDKLFQALLVLAVLIAVTWLSWEDKFTPSLGVLFGSLVGYIYGKKTS